MTKILEEIKELRKIWGGFRSARVLLTANNYRIFDHLKKPQSAKTVSKKLDTDLRATEILLDALTGIGLLNKYKGRYSNSLMGSKFLVSETPYYQGDILRHADILWKNWSGLDEVIKTGNPYHKSHNHEAFILGMHNIASLKVKDVINMIGLKGVKTALDLGGGPGTYSIEMVRRGVKVTLFDRPETVEIARRVIEKEITKENIIPPHPPLEKGGVGGFEKYFQKKINFIDGDFLYDDIGKGYDLIFASQILHSNSEKDNLHLLRKCKKALNKEGRIVVQEFYIAEDKTHPSQSSLFSVNMLVNTVSGRCYSPKEIKGWLLKAGLSGIEEKVIDDSVLIGGLYSSK